MMPQELRDFEDDIARDFEAGRINAPVHLGGGNEQQLIEIFAGINPWDWVLAGWRSHYHCLLKGVPADILKAAILDGRSVSLCFPRYKVLCSGIVGGIAPVAVGLAWAAKRRNDENPIGHTERVWCFLGDMSARSGIVHEAIQYADGHCLPVRWVIEDNGVSVCSDTKTAWGAQWGQRDTGVHQYQYTMTRPHSGTGNWVDFTGMSLAGK